MTRVVLLLPWPEASLLLQDYTWITFARWLAKPAPRRDRLWIFSSRREAARIRASWPRGLGIAIVRIEPEIATGDLFAQEVSRS